MGTNQAMKKGMRRNVNMKVPVQDVKTECKSGYEKRCENEWVCLDYPKQENLDYCQNKKWQPTNQGCVNLHTENCKDVPFTRYEDQEKCRKVHKQVPVQVKGKIAARVCPGKQEYEYTPSEIREMDFTGY